MRGDTAVTLDAVRNSALTQARAEAEAIRKAAQQQADQILTAAREARAALIAASRAAADRIADVEERERLADVRARARATILAAQQTLVAEATSAAGTRAQTLAQDPRFKALVDRLAESAQVRFQGAGQLEISPSPTGGFIARAGSTQLDYSLDAQLDRCLESMAEELEGLWK